MRRLLTLLALFFLSTAMFGSLSAPTPVHAATALSVTATPSTVQIGDRATVNLAGFTPNGAAYVAFQRPDGTIGTFWTQADGSGTYSFRLGFAARHGAGNELVGAYDDATATWAPFATVTVTGVAPLVGHHLTISNSTVTPGTEVTLNGHDFTPLGLAYVYFQRPDESVNAFWIRVSADGTFSLPLGFEPGHGCGTESLWAYDYARGSWSPPTTVAVTGCSALTAPDGLVVTGTVVGTTSAQETTVALQWHDNSAGETGFRIHLTLHRFYGGTDTQSQDVPANSTQASVTFVAGGINPVKTACFTVTALGGAGESAPSNEVCVTLIGG